MMNILGDEVTTGSQLDRVGQHLFGGDWLGTIAVDEHPRPFDASDRMKFLIVNTDKRNKPG